MTVFGYRPKTSTDGARETFFSATSFAKIGVSRMPSLIQRPIATSTMLIMNGARQPHVRNSSPEMALNASTARLARNSPAGTPN